MTKEKSETKLVAIFDTERGEREEYAAARERDSADPITVPLTRDGFNALMEHVCDFFDLPNDDSARQVIATHIHHISNEEDKTSFEKLGVVLRKSISNALTWGIDQEIKAKRNVERQAAIQKLEADAKAKAETEKDALATAGPGFTRSSDTPN